MTESKTFVTDLTAVDAADLPDWLQVRVEPNPHAHDGRPAPRSHDGLHLSADGQPLCGHPGPGGSTGTDRPAGALTIAPRRNGGDVECERLRRLVRVRQGGRPLDPADRFEAALGREDEGRMAIQDGNLWEYGLQASTPRVCPACERRAPLARGRWRPIRPSRGPASS